MALRMLGDAATKIPLTQHANGYATLNGTFNDIPRVFILDTTLPGLAHMCSLHSVEIGGPIWKETCPRECTSNLTIPMYSARNKQTEVDPFASNLTIAGSLSFPNFTSGRICDEERYDALDDLGLTANSVFGIGPVAPNGYPNVTTALDTMPWGKYSIYLTKTIQAAGSFLLPGGVDADLIAKEALVETKIPATGWTVNIDSFTTTGAALKADCSPTSPCKATVAAGSPVIQLGKDLWNSVMAGISPYDCYKTRLGQYDVQQCYDTAPLPNISFTIGDRTFYMNKTDYTIPIPKSDTRSVYVMISRGGWQPTYSADWILGTPFLRAYYSSFDNDTKSVSFYCKEGVNCASKGQPAPGTPASSDASFPRWLGGRSNLTLLLALASLTALAV